MLSTLLKSVQRKSLNHEEADPISITISFTFALENRLQATSDCHIFCTRVLATA
jgi:hypothetical protein